MATNQPYSTTEPTRAEVDALDAPTVIEFGTDWCGFCRAAQGRIAEVFAEHPEVHHLKIEDGPRRPLGRSFGIKLWPTLVFLHRGRETARVVRPSDAQELRQAFAALERAVSSGGSL